MADLSSSSSTKQVIQVYVRLMFVRIGEIDTLNEKYQAQASIEARWPIQFEKLPPDQQKEILNGKSITLPKYAETNWHPQLYIENALGDLKEHLTYSARYSRQDDLTYICEHRDIKGVFWEKLELQHFPSDTQDLSISVASLLYDDTVILKADPYRYSGVNHEAFVDQQEWTLYKHIDFEQRFVTEFILHDDEEDVKFTNDRQRPIVTVTCHAARHASYFFWNGFCLIFLITLVSFFVYAVPPNLIQNRLQSTCTLLLTSITFRWTVNKSLPTISYLTLIDIYAITCIFALVVQGMWHSILAAIILYDKNENIGTPLTRFIDIDQYVFLTLAYAFVIMHIGGLIWMYIVPYGYRRKMAKKDAEYERKILERKFGKTQKSLGQKIDTSYTSKRAPLQVVVHHYDN